MGNTNSSNINSDPETSSTDFDSSSPLPDDLMVPSYSVSPTKNATKRRLSLDPKPEACSRLKHGDSPEYKQPPQKKQRKLVAESEPELSEDIAESNYTPPTRSTSTALDECNGTTRSATIIPYIAAVTSAQGSLTVSSHAPNDNPNTSLLFSAITMPSQAQSLPQDDTKADTNPILELLSRYTGTEPVHSFTSIHSKHLSGNQILAQGGTTDATTIGNIVGKSADQIIEFLELQQTAKEIRAYAEPRPLGRDNALMPEFTGSKYLCHATENSKPNKPASSPEAHKSLPLPEAPHIPESSTACVHSVKNKEDTKEVGVETNPDQEPMSVLIRLLEGRISKLHQEKETLKKTASKHAQDLERSTVHIKTMRMKYEAQTAASRENLTNHVDILKRHQERISKDAQVNHANKDFLVRVKARLKDEMQKLASEKRKFEEEIRRCDAERRRLDEERKENGEVRAKLRVKERNECWMYRKIQMRDKNFEDLQEEKKMWEKEREELGIEMRRLKAELGTSGKKEPATSAGGPVEMTTSE